MQISNYQQSWHGIAVSAWPYGPADPGKNLAKVHFLIKTVINTVPIKKGLKMPKTAFKFY